jgi:hypothetical protein
VISTTGSLDSEFVDLAKVWLPDNVLSPLSSFIPDKKFSYLFEIVDPSDPHIVSEEPGAYLIGMRCVTHDMPYLSNPLREELLDQYADTIGVHRPKWWVSRFSDVVKEAKNCKHEGFVVYSKDQALKIKSPYYLVSKLFGRMGSEKLITGLNNPTGLKIKIDEEFYPVIDYLASIKDEFILMDEQQKIASVQKFIEESLYV